MQSENRLLDDLTKIATSAVGTLQSARQEVETMVRQQLEKLVAKMDLIAREEFDAVKEMAAKAREENERLEKRIAALEGGPRKRAAKPKSPSRKKPAAKKKA